MKKEEFTYLSADGKTKIHAETWIPDGEIRAVLQIAHGMAEYIDRYGEFALAMNEKGILVTGNDHLGHGQSVSDPPIYGYFAAAEGNRKVLADMKELHRLTSEKYPGLPYFLLGHSMGSFLCRQYIAENGKKLSGAVIMGTGSQPGMLTAAGKLICRLIAAFRGREYRSRFVDSMAFGSYNGKFGEKGGTDWLNSRKECVAAYNADPLCGFMFTLSAYYDMFDSIHRLADDSYVKGTPADLPVLLVSGSDDPVGGFGKAPAEVLEKLKSIGVRDVQLILYPGDRHEILNEKDRDTVYADIAGWIGRHTD